MERIYDWGVTEEWVGTTTLKGVLAGWRELSCHSKLCAQTRKHHPFWGTPDLRI
jgi:hypothetical protein